MEDVVKLLTPATNFSVVHLPGRRFPSVVFQGDSLFLLQQQVTQMSALLKAGDLAELSDEIEYARELLSEVLGSYEMVLARIGSPLPYYKQSD